VDCSLLTMRMSESREFDPDELDRAARFLIEECARWRGGYPAINLGRMDDARTEVWRHALKHTENVSRGLVATALEENSLWEMLDSAEYVTEEMLRAVIGEFIATDGWTCGEGLFFEKRALEWLRFKRLRATLDEVTADVQRELIHRIEATNDPQTVGGTTANVVACLFVAQNPQYPDHVRALALIHSWRVAGEDLIVSDIQVPATVLQLAFPLDPPADALQWLLCQHSVLDDPEWVAVLLEKLENMNARHFGIFAGRFIACAAKSHAKGAVERAHQYFDTYVALDDTRVYGFVAFFAHETECGRTVPNALFTLQFCAWLLSFKTLDARCRDWLLARMA